MITNVDYPEQMTGADRWMIRIEPDGTEESKQPQTIHETEPEAYFGLRWCRTRWGHPAQWASFDDAFDYALEHGPKEDEPPKPGEVTHLCFVLRDVTPGDALRFIAFDFDKCIDDDGNLDPAVDAMLNRLDTWVEISKNGRGLHAVAQYYGPAIRSQPQCPIGNTVVDVITSGQIVCTGTRFSDYSKFNADLQLKTLDDLFEMKPRAAKGDAGDCWVDEFSVIPNGMFHLFDEMKDWPICCRSKMGSTLGEGGDTEFFHAACHLARFGLTGEAARELLGHVRVDPVPFTHAEVTHKIECAYAHVMEEGEFGRFDARNQFDAVEPVEADVIIIRYGYEGNSLADHFAAFSESTRPKFIIDEVLFEQGSMIIGGQQKSFKTSVGLDLLISVATLKPFLNRFPIECDPKSVAIFSAETTEWMMTDYLRTILASKSLRVQDVKQPFTINSNVPAFTMDRSGEMKRNKAFEKYMAKHKPDLVFLDPLYRMFAGVNQADISQMGRALDYVEHICKDNDSMPIFCHHSRKPNTANGIEFPKMTLNDLSGAGGGAFARQWLLLSHTREYANDSARLHCLIGSSGGSTRNWIIDVETMANGRRTWQTAARVQTTADDLVNYLGRIGSQTIKQCAKALKTNELDIKNVAEKLDEAGVLDYNGDTLTPLNTNWKGEQEF